MPDGAATGAGWRYRLHGFALESELELPELVRADDDGNEADVVLRFGPTPENLDDMRARGACYATAPGEMLCWLAGVARFLVRAGREIVVEPAPTAAPEAIRSLVLSTPLAALLLQRGLLPLHASAVATPAGAVVFIGSAVSGKSTLAAALQQRGFMPLADDIAALRIDDAGAPVQLLPGYPGLRLWPDALTALGVEASGTPLRPGVVKHFVHSAAVFSTEPQPVAAIFTLDRDEASESRRLTGAATMAVLLDAVYRLAWAHGLGCDQRVFAQVATLARTTRVAPLAGASGPMELARRVVEEWRP